GLVVVFFLICIYFNLRYTMVVSLGYLTVCQVLRVFIFDYGVLSTDFSGPLMMMTQKITSLAFQLHDGMGRKQEELKDDQRRLAVRSRPSLLEYLSYNINFMSVLVGPCSNYKDYDEFINGKGVIRRLKAETDGIVQQNCKVHEPSPTAARPKFYFAWTLADALHNAAGFGISGVNERGEVTWDLICNVHIWEIETATSFKTFIDHWNIQTCHWLKRVCYDRAPRYRTSVTFLLSAIWHGVYPGYYFTFISAIPITLAARSVRRNFRHYFLSSIRLKLCYDVMTWAATQLTISYTVMPFLLLAVDPALQYYRSMFFHVHVLSILALILLPSKPSSRKPEKPTLLSNNNMKEG
ncbi:hypothetical protein DNTS_034542, partial [Danionella cerebrum]